MESEEGGTDEYWMGRALELAREAADLGEVPVGAVIVHEGRGIAEGFNRTFLDTDPTAHAEVVALRRAAQLFGDRRLLDTTLYVTLEPCAMCAGAIVLSRVPRVVFGAADPKGGMVETLGSLLTDERLNHRADVTGGVRAAESAQLLRSFFRARRKG